MTFQVFSDVEHSVGIVWIESSIGMHSFTYKRPISRNFQIDLNTIKIDQELAMVLSFIKDGERLLNSLKGKCQSISSFTREFQLLIESTIQAYPDIKLSPKYNPSYSAMSQILSSHLSEFGWDNIISISQDLFFIKAQIKDSDDRVHFFDIQLCKSYPSVSPVVISSLPQEVSLIWDSSKSALIDIRISIEKLASKYRDFLKILDEIDQSTRVIDPIHPTYSHGMRRIAINTMCSIVIEVNKALPRSIPEVKFLGPSDQVQSLKSKFNGSRSEWNEEYSVLSNLQRILATPFLPPNSKSDLASRTSEDDEQAVECGICYSYSLEGESNPTTGTSTLRFPDIFCDNSKCHRAFHHNCLVEWMQSLPSTRLSFHTLFGSCPYCHEALAVRTML